MHLPLSQEFGGDSPCSSRPPSECLLFTPPHTLSGLLLLAFFFFFFGGGVFFVYFSKFSCWKIKTSPKPMIKMCLH